MWIKQFNGEFKESWVEGVNFLFKQDKIFIMDNHRCATWCWLNTIDEIENNNLIHIDRHYDLLDQPNTIRQAIIDPGINLKGLTFDQYEDLSIQDRIGSTSKVFRWDNYILNLKLIFPNYFNTTIFSTFDFPNPNPKFVDYEIDFISFLNNIDDYINDKKEERWILNVDIDYFFNTLNEQRIKVFSDEFIRLFATKIKSILDNLTVVTFCLSPECCGGWGNSLHVMNIFCEVLRIDFSIDE